ncbi:hypothetical protein MRB53_040796 [Persea americana]|nr:hypothetical protein MRB53_040796 [Persea americana]
MNNRPTGPSDLNFSSAHTNINSVVTELKRDKLSIRNRISSIVKDAAFVENVQKHLQLPLIANERCGSWYIRPEAKRISKLTLLTLREKLKKPLKACWLTPDVDLSNIGIESDDFHPVYLCTASSRVSADIADDATYVQGAADDHESWALGLNAVSFWQNEVQLVAASEDELPDLISILVDKSTTISHRSLSLIKPTSELFICDNGGVLEQLHAVKTVVLCAQDLDPAIEKAALNAKIKLIHLVCGEGKVGSRQLRIELHKIDHIKVDGSVLCCCWSGRDLAVGVALAILCKYFSIDGQAQASKIHLQQDRDQTASQLDHGKHA